MSAGEETYFSERGASTGPDHALHSAVLMGGIVFAAALLGIYTRPDGLLAAVWPANAVMLGVLVVHPKLATLPSYAGATVGYLAADLMTGATLFSTALLTTANLTGVAVGHALFLRVPESDRRLQQPHSVLYLFLIASAAAAAAGLVGAIANPLLFDKDALTGGIFWFATELVNFLTILPVILSAPSLTRNDFVKPVKRRNRQHEGLRQQLSLFLPAIGLGLSSILALIIGGPGAVAFPIPALLWCALTYRIWTVSFLTLLFSFSILLLISMDSMAAIIGTHSQSTLLSMRLGVALVAIGPLMVASVMATRNDLVRQLERLASYDHLTEVFNKRAFQERARAQLADLAKQHAPVTALMLDIDKFKSINDTYGHAAGDRMLSAFAGIVRMSLRDNDLIGRLGGEEFGVLLPHCSRENSRVIAERIRSAFALTTMELAEGNVISATVSVGVSHAECAPANLDILLSAADTALYCAKHEGRNRVAGD